VHRLNSFPVNIYPIENHHDNLEIKIREMKSKEKYLPMGGDNGI
jgi:hypothetical protein